MSKIFQMILTGIFFTFIFDFFLFLGIKENYINPNGIHLYYNILFVDNQNIFIFTFIALFVGYITIYISNKIAIILTTLLFLCSSATLIPPVGKYIGELLFMQQNTALKTNKFSYYGDLLYKGRKNIYLYDYELKKVIILDKNHIKGNY